MIIFFILFLTYGMSFSDIISKYQIPLSNINATKTVELCVYTDKPIGPDLLNINRYDNIEFYNFDKRNWCYYGNGTYLIKLDPISVLPIYVASYDSLDNFCVKYRDNTICSNTSFNIAGLNVKQVDIYNYDGSVIIVNNTNPNSYLYWYNLSLYSYLGQCEQNINTKFNQIPYSLNNNVMFFILANFTQANIKYTDDINIESICNQILIIDKSSNITSNNLMIISDSIRNPGKIGLNVMPLGANTIITPYYKPELILESSLNISNRIINESSISIAIAGIIATYIKALKNTDDNLVILPYIMALSSCHNICENTSVSNIVNMNHRKIYTYRHTTNYVSINSIGDSKYLFYSYTNNIYSDYPGATNNKNVIFGILNNGSHSIPVYWNQSYDDAMYFIFNNNADLVSITSNRSFYKGYIESLVIEIKNNNPDSYTQIEGINIEAWNESGKIADLYSRVLDIPIKAMGTYKLYASFYIPEDIPNSYVKIRLTSMHVLEGYPIVDKSTEGLGRNISDILNLSYSDYIPLSIYKFSLPHYGKIGTYMVTFFDIDAHTKSYCRIFDQNYRPINENTQLRNIEEIYLVCDNRSNIRRLYLFNIYEIDFKNITDPLLPAIEIIPEVPIYKNNVNRIKFKVINRMLNAIDSNAILIRLFNSSYQYDIPIAGQYKIEPGENQLYADVFIPNVSFQNYTLALNYHIEDYIVGRGAVMIRNPADLPTQRLRYGGRYWLDIWKDPNTSIQLSIRRPSTLCGDTSSQNGMIEMWINDKNYKHVGQSVVCSCNYFCYSFYDSSFSNYLDFGIMDGKNVISYFLHPDLNRINRNNNMIVEPTFYEALKYRLNRMYISNHISAILEGEFSIDTNINLTNPIIGDIYLAESYSNRLIGNLTNNMVYPIKLKYIELFQNNIPIGYKRFEKTILPNETFQYYMDLIGTNLRSDQVRVNYVFEFAYRPAYFTKPIPMITRICETMLGETECQIEDPNFLRTYMHYNQNITNWSFVGDVIASNNYVFRINLLIPKEYLLSLGLYTVGISELYISSPSVPNGYLLDSNPANGTFRFYPGYLFVDDLTVISGRLSNVYSEVYIKLLLNYTELYNIKNVPYLSNLGLESKYFISNNLLYNKIINNNPISVNVISLIKDKITGYIYHSILFDISNNSEKIGIVLLENTSKTLLSGNCSSNLIVPINTHLGRLSACYGSSYMNISLYGNQNYQRYVILISENYQGRLNNLSFNTSKLTWEKDNVKIVLIPIKRQGNFILAEFLLDLKNSTSINLITERGDVYLAGTCLPGLSKCGIMKLEEPIVESYYINERSYSKDWKINSINVDASNPAYDPYFWPYEDISRMRHRYLLRFYLPYNVYSIFLPRASNLIINGLNTDSILDGLVYGGVNNIEYTSQASNPYAELYILFGTPTTYSGFEVRNLSVEPEYIIYMGQPGVLNYSIKIKNYGSINEIVTINENTTITILQGREFLYNISINARLGNWYNEINIRSLDNVFNFTIPIILNVSEDIVNISSRVNPRFYNILLPDNETGRLIITSNSTKPILVSINVDSPGVDLERYSVYLLPNSTAVINFLLNSLYIRDSKNITFYLRAGNLTINETIEVIINRSRYILSGNYSVNVNNTVFNLTRPEIGLGRLVIVSNLSDVELFSVYSDNPAVIFNRSYIILNPNTSGYLDFTIDSRFFDNNGTYNIYVISRAGNRSIPIMLYLNLNLSYNLMLNLLEYYLNSLILLVDKNVVCTGEIIKVTVLDVNNMYVDGAIVYYGRDYGYTRHGILNISLSEPGIYSIRATHPNYNNSRKISLIVSDCKNIEQLSVQLSNMPNEELYKLSINKSINYNVSTLDFPIYSPRYPINYTFIVPDVTIVNSTSLIRILSINGSPYYGWFYIRTPSNKTYKIHTDNQGYAIFLYNELGEYEYFIIENDVIYIGPITRTYYLLSSGFSMLNPIILLPVLLLPLLFRVAIIDIKTHDKNKLIIRITNIFGNPITNATVKINDKYYKTNRLGLIELDGPPERVKIYVKWYINIGKNDSNI